MGRYFALDELIAATVESVWEDDTRPYPKYNYFKHHVLPLTICLAQKQLFLHQIGVPNIVYGQLSGKQLETNWGVRAAIDKFFVIPIAYRNQCVCYVRHLSLAIKLIPNSPRGYLWRARGEKTRAHICDITCIPVKKVEPLTLLGRLASNTKDNQSGWRLLLSLLSRKPLACAERLHVGVVQSPKSRYIWWRVSLAPAKMYLLLLDSSDEDALLLTGRTVVATMVHGDPPSFTWRGELAHVVGVQWHSGSVPHYVVQILPEFNSGSLWEWDSQLSHNLKSNCKLRSI